MLPVHYINITRKEKIPVKMLIVLLDRWKDNLIEFSQNNTILTFVVYITYISYYYPLKFCD